MLSLVAIADVPAADVENLLDAAFGNDRHGRTAYRIRAGMQQAPKASFAALEDGLLVGTIQCWPIALAGDDGASSPLVMVGPVAVVPARQGDGIGQALMRHMLATADARPEEPALMLIGDPIYYGRFGFGGGRTRAWRAPGPVEQHRLLARGANIPDRAGMLGPRGAIGG